VLDRSSSSTPQSWLDDFMGSVLVSDCGLSLHSPPAHEAHGCSFLAFSRCTQFASGGRDGMGHGYGENTPGSDGKVVMLVDLGMS